MKTTYARSEEEVVCWPDAGADVGVLLVVDWYWLWSMKHTYARSEEEVVSWPDAGADVGVLLVVDWYWL
jgi:hypothetical protein